MLTILKNKTNLIIKNVICFYVGLNTEIKTVDQVKDTKEEDWTYQDYMTMACSIKKYNLTWLNKASVKYKYENDVINIDDDITDVHISLNKDNVNDTIIFQGQANDDMPINYEGLMRAFEYMHFFMLNTVDEIKMASDKFLSSNLLSSKNISQPKYILVTQDLLEDLTTDTNATRESFWTALDGIYKDNASINDYESLDDVKFVCKILGGSLGIGVFICKRSEIESILQTMFQIAPDAKFIIQEYKENTGDVRVHLLSVDGINYEVIACMKRNKISKDFRSNVSLGATTEKYKLNKEQEELVIKTAKISGCRWVGVDLMECNDGTNVVIEYNSSPGVQGISQQIKKNMFIVVFDKINKYLKKFAKYDPNESRDADNVRTCYSIYDPAIVEQIQMTWDGIEQYRRDVLNKCLSIQPGMFYEPNGKESPMSGLDCSGYVKYIYKEATGEDLPGLCAKYFQTDEYTNLEEISEEELLPGDIGVKHNSTILNHCGIYAGDDKWFESNCFYGIQLTDCDKFKHFFRVIVKDNTSEVDNVSEEDQQ